MKTLQHVPEKNSVTEVCMDTLLAIFLDDDLQQRFRFSRESKGRTNDDSYESLLAISWLIDWLIDYLTLADCNNPARGQKQGDIRTKDEKQETEKNKQTSNNKNKQITNRNRGGKQTMRNPGCSC